MMTLIFLIPFLAAVLLLLLPKDNATAVRTFSFCALLASSVLTLLCIIPLPFHINIPASILIPALSSWGIELTTSLDGIALPFILLTAILSPLGILYSSSIRKNIRLYHALYLLLAGGAYGLFLSANLFFIFLFLEIEVLTAFFLIVLWRQAGSDKNAYQFILYAALGGLLMFAFLAVMYFQTGAPSLNLDVLRSALAGAKTSSRGLAILLLSSLAIFSALFPFHAWGPLGYQAAHRATNVLLVGVMKQAGVYLFFRLALGLFPGELQALLPILTILALINILYVAWVAMAQRDPKLMAGYSGSSHMGYILLGILSFSPLGLTGALLLAFASGLGSALLFATIGRVEEGRGPFCFETVGGLGHKSPFLHFMFALSALAGAGLPGLLNFIGEILIFFSLLGKNPILLAVAILGVLLSAVYLLRAIRNIFHGPAVSAQMVQDETLGGKFAGVVIAGVLIALGVLPMLLIKPITPAVMKLLQL